MFTLKMGLSFGASERIWPPLTHKEVKEGSSTEQQAAAYITFYNRNKIIMHTYTLSGQPCGLSITPPPTMYRRTSSLDKP